MENKTIPETRFNEIKDRYLIAYKKNNHKKVIGLFFTKGWVYLETVPFGISKFRVSQLEEMTEVLESRLNKK
jgi:hypothetical protein